MTITEILAENARRLAANAAPYNPVAGDPDDPLRVKLDIPGLDTNPVWVPREMESDLFVRELLLAGSVSSYLKGTLSAPVSPERVAEVNMKFNRIRSRLDFPFWAASYVYIKKKGGGADVLFTLRRPQRKLVAALEEMRRANLPIRLILLKARQWGGSTCVQIYMAWLQLVHEIGLNSLIAAHQHLATDEIKDMFMRMLDDYPDYLFTDEEGNIYGGKRMVAASVKGKYHIPPRNCYVKLGSAERPNSCRGGDVNLVHLSEVGLWPDTKKKKAEDLIRSTCSGVLLTPGTMIVLESTANGTGNYFHREWEAAAEGESQFRPLFVAWYEIDDYALPLEDPEAFAATLLEHREEKESYSERCQPGQYLWWLWEKGATLEALNWYVNERRKYSDHALMAAEYPSDSIEAFAHSGARVFDKYEVERFRPTCRVKQPIRGEVDGEAVSGPRSLSAVHFNTSLSGQLFIWEMPAAPEPGTRVADRYLAVVDIGGRSEKADWSVVAVFDRLDMTSGGVPKIVAQWRGHSDIDLLAWNAARIARFYDDALLVIESNTLETHDSSRMVDGDQSHFILNQLKAAYPNLYERRQSEVEIREGTPKRYGFHTNTATKPMIIANLIRVVRDGLYVERDEACLDELLTYEQRPDGSYGAIRGCHDDLLMTRAIGLHICFNEMPLPAVRAVALRDTTQPGLFRAPRRSPAFF